MLDIRPRYLARYRNLAQLLWKYGRGEFASAIEPSSVFADGRVGEGGVGRAAELADDLEALGPTYIKLGQVLSTRHDLVGPEWIEGLSRLQDRIEPLPWSEITRVIEDELGAEPERIFGEIDREPLASASLAQVHRATMRDGRQVVVKVQRPGVAEEIAEDLDAFEELAGILEQRTKLGRRHAVRSLVRRFRTSLEIELDYRRELGHQEQIGRVLARFSRLRAPEAIADLSTRRVLVMEEVHGRKLDDISSIARLELDSDAIASDLFEAFLQQVLVEGLFHADPHPGNFLLTEEGCVVLLDFGQVGRVPTHMRRDLMRLLLGITEGNGRATARAAQDLSERSDEHDRAGFERLIEDLLAKYSGRNVAELSMGRLVLDLVVGGAVHGYRLADELTMLGKCLMSLDRIGELIAPGFDLEAALVRLTPRLMRMQATSQLATKEKLMRAVLDAEDFIAELPRRLDRTLDLISGDSVSLKVHAFDERAMIESFQKIANRITVGLIIASMIVGAALIMRIPSSMTLFGYPALAIVFFLGAALFGVSLIWQMVKTDR